MSTKKGLEIERKFIIEMPELTVLEKIEGYTRSEILQIYLKSSPRKTRRIRKRTYPDRISYTETRKMRLDAISSTEIEREIGLEEFERLRLEMKSGTAPVIKVRHTFPYKGHTFEIDVYPQWKKSSVMEVELSGRDERAELPPFIKIVREVTGNKEYSNASMSRKFPNED